MLLKKSTLSIIVCANSDNPYMDQALSSLVAATEGLPVETILVANGGYVPSPQVAAHFHQIVQLDIGGLGYARNRGVEASSGAFVTFFDADDILERDYVQAILDSIASGIVGQGAYAFSATRNIGPQGEPLRPGLSARMTRRPNRTLWFKHPFTGATLLIARALFLQAGGYKWGGYAEDYELSIRLRATCGEAAFLAHNFYVYRLHGAAMSSSATKKIRGVIAIQLYALMAGRGLKYGAGAIINLARLAVAALR